MDSNTLLAKLLRAVSPDFYGSIVIGVTAGEMKQAGTRRVVKTRELSTAALAAVNALCKEYPGAHITIEPGRLGKPDTVIVRTVTRLDTANG